LGNPPSAAVGDVTHDRLTDGPAGSGPPPKVAVVAHPEKAVLREPYYKHGRFGNVVDFIDFIAGKLVPRRPILAV